MQIKMERLPDCAAEVNDLILGYYADTNAQDGIPPLKMDWAFFARLDAVDKLVLFTARIDRELVGVNMYMLSEHPQHAGMPCALCNTLAVATRHRGKGIGRVLVQEATDYFEKRPEKWMIVHHFRTIYDTVPLFPKLGFDLVEHVYMKVL
jgi:GNAT superfamily N-acetyltransferase